MTMGDVKSTFLLADNEIRPNGDIYVTTPKECVKKGMHPEQHYEAKNGYRLEDHPQDGGGFFNDIWWRS